MRCLEKILSPAKTFLAASLSALALYAQPVEIKTNADGSWEEKATANLYLDKGTNNKSSSPIKTQVTFSGKREGNRLSILYVTTNLQQPETWPAEASFNSTYLSFLTSSKLEATVSEKKLIMDKNGKITSEKTELKENLTGPLVWIGNKMLEKLDEYDPIKKTGEETGLFEGGIKEAIKYHHSLFEKASTERAKATSGDLSINPLPLHSRTSNKSSAGFEVGSRITLDFTSEDGAPAQIIIYYDVGLKKNKQRNDIVGDFGRIQAYTTLFEIETTKKPTQRSPSQ